jgi:hypothetical protein
MFENTTENIDEHEPGTNLSTLNTLEEITPSHAAVLAFFRQ